MKLNRKKYFFKNPLIYNTFLVYIIQIHDFTLPEACFYIFFHILLLKTFFCYLYNSHNRVYIINCYLYIENVYRRIPSIKLIGAMG